jgi:hypothetical protein
MDKGRETRHHCGMTIKTTHPHLQFRFWCEAARSHVSDYNYRGRVDELFQDDDILIPEQCTAIRDLSGVTVYEGDIVEVPVALDMPAWEGGVRVGEELLRAMGGSTVSLEVARDPACPTNLYLSGEGDGGVELFLPVSWVGRGKVVGHRWTGKV